MLNGIMLTQFFCDKFNLNSIQFLNNSCFSNTSLIEINLPTDFRYVPQYEFYNCISLTSFVSSCAGFGEYSFCNCTSLKVFKYNFRETWSFHDTSLLFTAIEEITLRSSAMSSSAFSTLPLKKLIVFNQDEYFYGSNMDGIRNFPNLKTIEITSDSKYIYLINYNIEEIITPVDPNFRCTINIAGCPKLKNLPNGIEYVKNVGDLPEVESVDLSFCKRIYRNSFFNCPKLKRIIGWGDHEMTVEPSLFELCPMIDINIWNNNLKFYGVTMFSDKYSPLQYSYIKELTINSSKIPTFYGCKQLKKVVFIEGCGIREIDYHAFENCESLTDVQLCNSIESISPYAFANTNISNLDLTNVRQIALTAFYNTPLKEIIINNNIFQSRPDYYWPTDVVLLEYNERNHSKFRNFICLSGKFGSQGIDNSRFCEIY